MFSLPVLCFFARGHFLLATSKVATVMLPSPTLSIGDYLSTGFKSRSVACVNNLHVCVVLRLSAFIQTGGVLLQNTSFLILYRGPTITLLPRATRSIRPSIRRVFQRSRWVYPGFSRTGSDR
jgi:hypothetical protein